MIERQRLAGTFSASLSQVTRDALVAASRPLNLDRGGTYFRQGDPPWTIGLVRQGHLKLTADGSSGRTELLHIYGPNDLVGIESAVTDTPRRGTSTALDDVRLLSIDTPTFMRSLDRHPDMYPALLRELASLLRDAHASMAECGAEPIPVRLARLLQRLSGVCDGTGNPTSTTVDLTQDELAQAMGVSRESTARILRDWRERGVLVTGRRSLKILRMDQICAQAHQRLEGCPAQPGHDGCPVTLTSASMATDSGAEAPAISTAPQAFALGQPVTNVTAEYI